MLPCHQAPALPSDGCKARRDLKKAAKQRQSEAKAVKASNFLPKQPSLSPKATGYLEPEKSDPCTHESNARNCKESDLQKREEQTQAKTVSSLDDSA